MWANRREIEDENDSRQSPRESGPRKQVGFEKEMQTSPPDSMVADVATLSRLQQKGGGRNWGNLGLTNLIFFEVGN